MVSANVTRCNVSLERSQLKGRLRPKPRTYMDSFSRMLQKTTELRKPADASEYVTRPLVLFTYEHRGTPHQTFHRLRNSSFLNRPHQTNGLSKYPYLDLAARQTISQLNQGCGSVESVDGEIAKAIDNEDYTSVANESIMSEVVEMIKKEYG